MQLGPDQAFDQGLHYLLTGFSIKNIKSNKIDLTLYITNGIVQHIIVEESTSMQRNEIIDKHQQSHKAIKPSFVNYYTFYRYVNFYQRSDKWFFIKCDN